MEAFATVSLCEAWTWLVSASEFRVASENDNHSAAIVTSSARPRSVRPRGQTLGETSSATHAPFLREYRIRRATVHIAGCCRQVQYPVAC